MPDMNNASTLHPARNPLRCGAFVSGPSGAQRTSLASDVLVGDIIAVDLPDPIPNSEVKHQQAHGTAGVTLWESRYRRPHSLKPSVESKDSRGLFFALAVPEVLPTPRRRG